ncbi:hypothetical protein GF361_00010 [Candidatus Woesearchaeota archaeon]|nr:hypothetical protein [Candidatus Woesearchaeota archaeon]
MSIFDVLHFGKKKIVPPLDDAVLELSGVLMQINNISDTEDKEKAVMLMQTHVSKIEKARKSLIKAIAGLQKNIKSYPRAKKVGERLFELIKPLERVVDRIKLTSKERKKISIGEVMMRLEQNKRTIMKIIDLIEKETKDIR